MTKRFMLVDPAHLSRSKQTKTITSTTKWELCALCQKDNGNFLQFPRRNTKPNVRNGYSSLATNLNEFQNQGCLPMDIDLKRLDDGSGIEETFKTNLAKWHITCSLKFSDLKLARELRKKDIKDSPSSPPSTLYTRSRSVQDKSLESTCFFCEEPAGRTGFRHASTFDIDFRVRKCAHELQDTKLLAMLATGDMIALEAKYHAKCLVALYNKASRDDISSGVDETDLHLHGIAFAQLVAYMEDFRKDEDNAPIWLNCTQSDSNS